MSPSARHYGARRDENEPEIVRALVRVGCKVERLDLFDLLVLFRGDVHMLEIKRPPGPRGGTKGRLLTRRQADLMRDGWPLCVVTTTREALCAIGAMRGQVQGPRGG